MPRRGLDALVFPGKYLVDKIAGLKKQQQEQSRRKVTERELAHLHHKIDKLLVRLEEHEPEQAQTQDEECAICISAKATMQTFPCGHRVVCRKCFVKTIQMAVSQRLLPLRCVICRAKILRLKQLSPSNKNKSQQHQQQQEHGSGDGHHGFQQSPLANPLPDGQLLQRHIRRPPYLVNSSILYPMSSHRRAANLRQRMAFKPPNLLSIPESEELDLVNAVQDREVLCPDFGNIEKKWSEKEILKAQLNAKDQLGKADHYQVAKWLSKFRQFKPPSILKGIRNRWKK
ncbi:uncharacterized protein LOC129980901 [Argiope bruennichi]|uniref:RING-type domain-containing protein n=1 Tax=Argiope bruennichi TaxID=94029 RepID=A0A8T0G1F0_ARGBR|nr:uncharacterized protein LOC129980901 [Argiope bruennichi]XP_055947349.1 uncharacterized protein LOC129980901 [Argiope bruennichi]KAF8796278.1 hypothetical protein HNY73_000674 [Argiope bruennichi]